MKEAFIPAYSALDFQMQGKILLNSTHQDMPSLSSTNMYPLKKTNKNQRFSIQTLHMESRGCDNSKYVELPIEFIKMN